MKKVLLLIAIVAAGFTANAQDGTFNAGANFGLPIGDAGDTSSFAIGAEVNYLFEISDEFKVGPSLSYVAFLGKDQTLTNGGVSVTVEGTNSSVLPIAAAARYSVSEKFVLGADLGYAVGISPSGNEGGLYYRPLVGYNIAENTMIQASYTAVTKDGFTAANIGLGVMFGL